MDLLQAAQALRQSGKPDVRYVSERVRLLKEPAHSSIDTIMLKSKTHASASKVMAFVELTPQLIGLLRVVYAP